LYPGQPLYFNGDLDIKAIIKPDGKLLIPGFIGSIHQTAKHLSGDKPCNGWEWWFYENENGEMKKIDELRSKFASESGLELGD
jgi:hypothetical protein